MALDPNRIEVPPIEPVRKQYVQERKYKLITPLFGGGVEPKVADPITVVRIPEIRGQLRFWWRACRGGQFGGNLAEMKAAEDAIWGAAGRASAISISLISVQPGVEYTNPLDNQDVPKYAAFPMEDNPQPLRNKVQFSLKLRYETEVQYGKAEILLKVKPEIDAALWAWETFGGIGGRTRRGFGAIQCTEVDQHEVILPTTKSVKDYITQHLAIHIQAEHWPPNVPHLSKTMDFNVLGAVDATGAWKRLINELRSFRQMRSKGNSGRSLWPEPSAIRQLYKSAPNSSSEVFPRAAFGLPIIFHFPQEKHLNTQLISGDGDRLASPLILRPLACSGGGAVGLAARLSAPMPDRYLLKGDNGSSVEVSGKPTQQQAKATQPLNGETDVLTAFLNYLNRK